jgi:N-acetylmuramoyl-L-alanine amidase
MNLKSIVLATLMLPSWCFSAWAGSLEYWKFNQPLNRLEIITNNGVRPQVQLLSNPTRLVIDLAGVTVGPTERKEVTSYIKEVRIGQFDSQTGRMVVELDENYTIRPWEVQIRSLAPNRWYIQLPKFQTPDIYTPPEENVAIKVPPAKPLPQSSSSSSSYYSNSRSVIVIDPGHGGKDPGAIGLRSIQEKKIVLDISQKVTQILEKRGYRVIMTRQNDRFVSLQGRVNIAEKYKAKAFISIHANSISRSKTSVNGVETYYYSSGYRLAQSIHRSIIRRLDVRDRGVRKARFYVLRKTSMPAVLVEVGFVTGSSDSAKLSNASYRQRMAEAIAEGIISHVR